jgi:hypothetical protein
LSSFLVVLAALLVRNAHLFTTKIYENQDFAANTIAILQAKHFQLLTGNYSKEGFYHPGPAYLYLMAAGESLFHDVLHAVPTPWNGQLLAVLLLNAALIGLTLAVLARHVRSVRVTLVLLLVVLAFVCVHPLTVNSAWFPYLYFAPALLMLTSSASVAAGQTFALPALALSAWLCIHGHAEFLLFAPVTIVVALAGLGIAHRRDLLGVFRGAAWHWILAAVISALFALPVLIYIAQDWPGQFGRYLDYRQRVSALHLAHHSLATSIGFTLRFWWPGTPTPAADRGGGIVAVVLVVVALVLALRCPVPGLRRFLLWSLAMAGVMTVLMVYFASAAIVNGDIIRNSYEGYFYWTAPLVVVLVIAAGTGVRLPDRRTVMLPLTGAVLAGVVAAALVPQVKDNFHDPPAKYTGVGQLPRLVSTMTASTHGRPIVIAISEEEWFDAAGVIAYADRTGVRACVEGSAFWGIVLRPRSRCATNEVARGVVFTFSPPNMPVPSGQALVERLPSGLITQQQASAAK